MKIDMDIRGAKEMERLLKILGPNTARKVAAKALRAGAKPIVQEAKRLVPEASGDLKKSIIAKMEKDRYSAGDERVIFVGFAKPTSRRAHLTEFGTVHHAAQPFLRPALDNTAMEALDEMGRVTGEGITKEATLLAKPIR